MCTSQLIWYLMGDYAIYSQLILVHTRTKLGRQQNLQPKLQQEPGIHWGLVILVPSNHQLGILGALSQEGDWFEPCGETNALKLPAAWHRSLGPRADSGDQGTVPFFVQLNLWSNVDLTFAVASSDMWLAFCRTQLSLQRKVWPRVFPERRQNSLRLRTNSTPRSVGTLASPVQEC
jgi:hypothetical protein